MMLVGVALAAGPLLWVVLRSRKGSKVSRVQVLTLLTLFLTFDLVLFGAFTRLTDSGLGCPDWPGCYGSASPLGAHAEITAAQTAMPTGPVTHGKAWVEMVHRYLATGVGVLIIALTVMAWRAHRQSAQVSAVSPWWPTATLVWVCVQGAFGALTVTMKLFPAIVSLHLLGGYLLLVLLAVQAAAGSQASMSQPPVPSSVRWWMAAALLMLLVQAMSGAWVSTNYAVLACTEFPQCQGQWWPTMDFAQGFTLWRELGLNPDGSHITVQALTAIHVVHRLLAGVTVLVLGTLVWRMWRWPTLNGLSRWLAALLALQIATGLSNVVLDWPLVAAVLHTGGAGAMMVVLVWALTISRISSSQFWSLSAAKFSS
ncbi:MAG: COX15/CtaA family protein [Rhodoferax sp.]|nr:COX15/CtaA family protein [Rhodoferax sp.]